MLKFKQLTGLKHRDYEEVKWCLGYIYSQMEKSYTSGLQSNYS